MTTDQPRRGDTINTAEQFNELFGEGGVEYVVVVEQGWRPWLVTSTEDGDLYAWSWREEGGSGEPVITTDGLGYPLTLLALPPGEQPPSVEDARAEAERIVTEHPGYEYRKERGGDVCIGCGAKVYGSDGYGRHVAEKTLTASRAVPSYQGKVIDAAHLTRQGEFSERTFGPGARTAGVLDHIRKELAEIEADPTDVGEWVDVVILALDGAWRAGWEPQQIIDAIHAKQARNEARTWPDWRTADRDKAIEHDRTSERTVLTDETEVRDER